MSNIRYTIAMMSGTTISLSPKIRGAPDELRLVLQNVIANPGDILIASQQLRDRPIIDLIISDRRIRCLIESQYLREQPQNLLIDRWVPVGVFEENRQGLMALLRSGVEVRGDLVSSALQHANFAVVRGDEDSSAVSMLTSANLSPGSIDSHYNWIVESDDLDLAEMLTRVFDQAWDGDFRKIDEHCSVALDEEVMSCVAGSQGQALSMLDDLCERCVSKIDFAFFNISKSSKLIETIVQACSRGVQVTGVVDADQGGQSWDAVGKLRDAGANVRYYPGAMTGASGRRMHYKFASIDNSVAYLGTANVSASAEQSLELALSFESSGATAANGHSFKRASQLTREINRLLPLSKWQPIPVQRL
ncbi:MAG: phospholipase D-like domain-containing protein [Erythrobacter sp.]